MSERELFEDEEVRDVDLELEYGADLGVGLVAEAILGAISRGRGHHGSTIIVTSKLFLK